MSIRDLALPVNGRERSESARIAEAMARLRKHLGWWAAEVSSSARSASLVAQLPGGEHAVIDAPVSPTYRFFPQRLRAYQLEERVGRLLLDVYPDATVADLVFSVTKRRTGLVPMTVLAAKRRPLATRHSTS